MMCQWRYIVPKTIAADWNWQLKDLSFPFYMYVTKNAKISLCKVQSGDDDVLKTTFLRKQPSILITRMQLVSIIITSTSLE